jgi:hypothetical protein
MKILNTLLIAFSFLSNANNPNISLPLLELSRSNNVMQGIVLGNRMKEVVGSVVTPFSRQDFNGSIIFPSFLNYFERQDSFNSNFLFHYAYSAVNAFSLDFSITISNQFIRNLNDFQVWESNMAFSQTFGFGNVKYISFKHDNKNYLLLVGFHSLFKERNKALFNRVTHCFINCTKFSNVSEIHSFYGTGSCVFLLGSAIKRININSGANGITSLNFSKLPNLEEFFMKWKDETFFPISLQSLDLSNTALKKISANFVGSQIQYLSLSGCKDLKVINGLFAQGASFSLDLSGVNAEFENPHKLYWSLKTSRVTQEGFEIDGLDFCRQVVKP